MHTKPRAPEPVLRRISSHRLKIGLLELAAAEDVAQCRVTGAIANGNCDYFVKTADTALWGIDRSPSRAAARGESGAALSAAPCRVCVRHPGRMLAGGTAPAPPRFPGPTLREPPLPGAQGTCGAALAASPHVGFWLLPRRQRGQVPFPQETWFADPGSPFVLPDHLESRELGIAFVA